MARSGRELNNRRRKEKWQTCWRCRDHQRTSIMAQASSEKLEHTAPAKRKEWPQCHIESGWQGGLRQSRLCQKKNEQSRLSKEPNREEGESQGEREPHFGE